MTNIDLCYKVEKNRPQPKSETNHHHKEHIQISGKLLEPTPPHPPCDLHIPRGLSGFFNVHLFRVCRAQAIALHCIIRKQRPPFYWIVV